jgi:hypothetical protein
MQDKNLRRRIEAEKVTGAFGIEREADPVAGQIGTGLDLAHAVGGQPGLKRLGGRHGLGLRHADKQKHPGQQTRISLHHSHGSIFLVPAGRPHRP